MPPARTAASARPAPQDLVPAMPPRWSGYRALGGSQGRPWLTLPIAPDGLAMIRQYARKTPVWPATQGLKLNNGKPTLVPTLVLGIETTCDETAAAVVERQADGAGRILSNIVR